jgi:hypothetical protein
VDELRVSFPDDVRRALDAAQRTLGVVPEQAVQVAVREFLRSRGLLPDPGLAPTLPPQRETRGRAEMVLVRGPGL